MNVKFGEPFSLQNKRPVWLEIKHIINTCSNTKWLWSYYIKQVFLGVAHWHKCMRYNDQETGLQQALTAVLIMKERKMPQMWKTANISQWKEEKTSSFDVKKKLIRFILRRKTMCPVSKNLLLFCFRIQCADFKFQYNESGCKNLRII